MDLAFNNQQRLMCHKTQPTNQPKTFPKDSRTGVSPSNYLVSYVGHSLGGKSYSRFSVGVFYNPGLLGAQIICLKSKQKLYQIINDYHDNKSYIHKKKNWH